MIKKLLKIVSTLLLITLILAGIFFYSIFISVERINIQYESIASTEIPEDLNNVQIAFISDLEYNHFMNKERLTKMVATINEANPDVVIFGGDIFSLPLTNVPNDAIKQEVGELLKEIKAPLGKFAVLGEQDNIDESVSSMVKTILYASDFELIDNTSIKIRNGSNQSINLVGLDSQINGSMDLTQAFANVNAEEFNIVATHCPDTITMDSFPKSKVDIMFAGHSHSSQIYIPFIGPLSSEEGAKQYNHGSYKIDNTLLHVSNGMGTSTVDMRLFSPPQMLVYRLQHTSIPEVIEPPEESSPQPPTEPQAEAPTEETPPADPVTEAAQ